MKKHFNLFVRRISVLIFLVITISSYAQPIDPPPDIYNVTGGGNYCSGGTPVNVGLDFSNPYVSYQFYKDGVAFGAPVQGTGSAFSIAASGTGVYTCKYWFNYNSWWEEVEMYGSAYVTVSPPVSVSVNIEASVNPVCAGSSVTFTATPTNGGLAPAYLWEVNGIDVGANSATYSFVPNDGDQVTCILTSNATCLINNEGFFDDSPVASNPVTMNVIPNLPISVSIATDEEHVSYGSSVVFTATPTNGGSSPVYQWKINGIIAGSNSNTLFFAPLNNDVVTCIMTSDASCVSENPATSNAITIFPFTSIAIDASSNPVCSGTPVTYTFTPIATYNESDLSYMWYVNGYPVLMTNLTSYSYTPSNGDIVNCFLGSIPVTVIPDTSNGVTMTVNNLVSPSVSISPSNNNVLANTVVDFTASSPGFTIATAVWHKNATTIANNAMTYTYTPANLDSVYAVLTFSEGCTSTTISNKVIMNVITTAPTVITMGPTNIVQTYATLNGKVTDNGGDVNAYRGFDISLNKDANYITSEHTESSGYSLMYWQSIDATSDGSGFYSCTLTDLMPNTIYYYRAVACSHGLGCSYGAVNVLDTRNVTQFNGTGFWSDASKWTNGIPTAASSVYINGNCTAAADGICFSLGILSGGALTINSGDSIHVTDFVYIYSSATSTGALIQNGVLNVNPRSCYAERYASGGKSHLVSSPLKSNKTYTFYGSYLYYFNEPYNAWSPITNGGNFLDVGRGYSVYTDTAKNYLFYGSAFNKGDIELCSINNQEWGFSTYTWGLQFTFPTKGNNLVGNPYPCRLNGNINTWNRNNVSNSIQIFDPVANNYLSWNGVTGGFSGIIAENQGFFVKATGPAPALIIPAASQTVSTSTFKSFVPNQLSLTIKGNTYSDDTRIYFNAEATEGLDNQFDVEKMFGPDESPQLFSITADNALSINCLPEVNENVVVLVGLKVGVNTSYTINATDVESFNAGTQIYLEDLKAGKMINLTEQSSYTFDATTSDNVNRFKVHFGKASTTPSSTAINAYAFENTVYVNNPSLVKINEVVIYNALGQVVTSFKPEISTLSKYNHKLASGSYIVKMLTDNNVFSNKVTLK